MKSAQIAQFTEFDDFYEMARGALRSLHRDIHVFSFTDVGQETTPKTPLFKTTFYQIGIFQNVNLEVGYFDENYKIAYQNAIIIFQPGQVISFSRADKETSGFAVMFKQDFIDCSGLLKWNSRNDLKLIPPFTGIYLLAKHHFTDIFDIASKLHSEYHKPDLISNDVFVKLYCQLLLEKIIWLTPERTQPIPRYGSYETTARFKSLVSQNIHITKKIADYASMLHLTEKTLIAHFKSSTGLTPKGYINEVIIAESKAMLKSGHSVYEVARYFNFTDQAHFTNFFRQVTGNTPAAFARG